MRLSKYILPTQKEDPADATVLSHKLMIRAGLVKKESAGMYAYLPLGFRVLQKVTNIIREEMNRADGQEFLMPEMTNADLWKESGRWDLMGAEMIKIKDRNNLEYALAPTHEEAFTSAVKSVISSYRDLPVTVYQINTKFRDEIRPRFGVIRSKEFIMKDAYSFDLDENGLDDSYQAMRKAYRRIFERCGIETIPVEADSGTMGGSNSEEFMVPSEIGEENLLLCNGCDYRANQEKAEFKRVNSEKEEAKSLEKVDTPNIKTIDELVEFFKEDSTKFLKSVIYMADEKPVMVVVPGDREVNEHKLKNALGCLELDLAPDSVVEEITNAKVGFAGPVDNENIRKLFDISVENLCNCITGANETDKHLVNVNPGRDFEIKEKFDLISATDGDKCPTCGKEMYVKKGIEVGHIFKLGDKYTKAMGVSVLNEQGKSVTPLMGCYGVGVTRTVATIVEQCNDERGIIWPKSVAPFQIHLIGIAKKAEEISEVDEIYETLLDNGFDVLYDDRKKVSPGFKFGDADLIGIPIRVTVGKDFFNNGEIEIKLRSSTDKTNISKENLVEKIKELVK